jgi:hypothetical protein
LFYFALARRAGHPPKKPASFSLQSRSIRADQLPRIRLQCLLIIDGFSFFKEISFMKRTLAVLIAALCLCSASLAMTKDYQVTGPVVDIRDDAIIVKKGNDNWEIARDKGTKTSGEIKKGDKIMIKYKMTATSIEGKEAPKSKAAAGNKPEAKKSDSKTK